MCHFPFFSYWLFILFCLVFVKWRSWWGNMIIIRSAIRMPQLYVSCHVRIRIWISRITVLLFIDDSRWEIVTRTRGGPMQEFSVSYQSLLPSTVYQFRVIAYNIYGISYPIYSKDAVVTPSKLYLEYGYLQHKPFYRQQWFMVSLAATSIIIIIMIVAVLCVKSKSYKYKRKSILSAEDMDICYWMKKEWSSDHFRLFDIFRRGTENSGRIHGHVDRWSSRAGTGIVSLASWSGRHWHTVGKRWHIATHDRPQTGEPTSGRRNFGQVTATSITSFGGVSQRRRESQMLRRKSRRQQCHWETIWS